MKRRMVLIISGICIFVGIILTSCKLQGDSEIDLKNEIETEVSVEEETVYEKEESKSESKQRFEEVENDFTIRSSKETDYSNKIELTFDGLYYEENLSEGEMIFTTEDYKRSIYNLDTKKLKPFDIAPRDEKNEIFDMKSDGDWIVFIECEKNADQGKNKNIINREFNWILWAKNMITSEIRILDKIKYSQEDYKGTNDIQAPFSFDFSNGIFAYAFIDYDVNKNKSLSKINYYNFSEKELYTIDTVNFDGSNLLKEVSTDGKHITYTKNYEFDPSGEFFYKKSDAVIFNIEKGRKEVIPTERYVIDTAIYDDCLALIVQREGKSFLQDVILYNLEKNTYQKLIYENSTIEKYLKDDQVPKHTEYKDIYIDKKYIYLDVGYNKSSIYFDRNSNEVIDLTKEELDKPVFGRKISRGKFIMIEENVGNDGNKNRYKLYELK